MGLARLVDMDDIPDYPGDLIDARMTSDYFTVFWHDRWLNSELHLTSPLDVQGAAMNLFFIARKQNPIGSLPDNDKMLAKLLHIDLDQWQELRARPVNPLHNWRPYRVGDKIVLGHPVVIEVALDALHRREAREVKNTEKATYQRLQRLRDALQRMGVHKSAIGDDTLVERMDQWLLENHTGQRRQPAYDRVIKVAAREGWFRNPEAKRGNFG